MSRNTKPSDFTKSLSSKESGEVMKLLKQDRHDGRDVLNYLRSKNLDENTINDIYVDYTKKYFQILKKAQKFKEHILNRYGFTMPVYDIIKKARKWKKKLGLTDSEFDVFVKMVITERKYVGLPSIPNTKMAKTLGFGQYLTSIGGLNISDKEMPILKQILDLWGQTGSLHKQLILQHLTYNSCAPESLVGKKCKNDNIYSYIHPVLAALFIPKFSLLDEHMLIANIGEIVKCKRDKRPIHTKPDAELYWDIITDPNDHACNIDSAIKDLLGRYILQTKIWDCVFNLRQGRYYIDKAPDFLAAIENCRSSVYDAPDLTYLKDEGAILRRLLGAFSLRPTIVSTSRMYDFVHRMPYGSFGTTPLSIANITQLTTIPMITIRLPIELTGQGISVDLQEGLSRPQWYVENGSIIPKVQKIIYSSGMLFFYINRRFQTINIARRRLPYNFVELPASVTGWEKLNTQIVNFDDTMTVLNDTYKLRSVVLIEHSPAKKNLIIGCSAAIIAAAGDDESARGSEDTAFLYNPQAAGLMFREGDVYKRNTPVTEIPINPVLNNEIECFRSMASKRGTIFVYEKIREGSHPYIKSN